MEPPRRKLPARERCLSSNRALSVRALALRSQQVAARRGRGASHRADEPTCELHRHSLPRPGAASVGFRSAAFSAAPRFRSPVVFFLRVFPEALLRRGPPQRADSRRHARRARARLLEAETAAGVVRPLNYLHGLPILIKASKQPFKPPLLLAFAT